MIREYKRKLTDKLNISCC